MSYGEPWGTAAQTACRWAFALLASSDAMASVLGNLREGTRARRDLMALELRAQGAQIRGMVETLDDPVSKCYLIAYYLPHPMEERQPGGGIEFVDRFAAQREAAESAVAWWLLKSQGTGIHRIRGYREIVAQYFLGDKMIERIRRLGGRDMGLDRIRALMKMDRNKVAAKREECVKQLKDLDKRAHQLAENRLIEARLI